MATTETLLIFAVNPVRFAVFSPFIISDRKDPDIQLHIL